MTHEPGRRAPIALLSPLPPPRRAVLRRLAGTAFGAAVLLAGCSGVGAGRTLSVSKAQLQQKLGELFPIDRRLLLFEVQVGVPTINLLPQSNRIGADAELTLGERLGGGRMRARLAADSALRFEPSDGSVRLSQVKVDKLSLDNTASQLLGARGMGLGAMLAEQVLEDLTVWRASASQLKQLQSLGINAATITVTDGGIDITPRAEAR